VACGQHRADAAGQVQMLQHAAVHGGIEKLKGVAARLFGPVHRQIGVFEQGVDVWPSLVVDF